jgi:hypothetical protein
MIAGKYHVEVIDDTVPIDIFRYPAGTAVFTVMVTYTNEIEIIDSTVSLNIIQSGKLDSTTTVMVESVAVPNLHSSWARKVLPIRTFISDAVGNRDGFPAFEPGFSGAITPRLGTDL